GEPHPAHDLVPTQALLRDIEPETHRRNLGDAPAADANVHWTSAPAIADARTGPTRRRSTMSVNKPDDAPSAHRSRFHQDLAALEEDTQAMADLARGALEDAVGALATSDATAWDAVIAGDDRVDDAYIDIERRAIDLVVREQPV